MTLSFAFLPGFGGAGFSRESVTTSFGRSEVKVPLLYVVYA